jgi:acetyltransferase-like isoleucine patch superfamily enzyme
MRWICRRKFKHFGEGAEFRPYAFAVCTEKISIGRNGFIHPLSVLEADETEEGWILIEDDVSIGPGVHLYAVNNRYDQPHVPIKYQGYTPAAPIVIKRGSWIGANAIILKGVTIGENAVVAACSVVRHDVPDHTLVAGVPARIIKKTYE